MALPIGLAPSLGDDSRSGTVPKRRLENASSVPPGDHTGIASSAESDVRRVRADVFKSKAQTSRAVAPGSRRVRATFVPFGEGARSQNTPGWISASRFRPARSTVTSRIIGVRMVE